MISSRTIIAVMLSIMVALLCGLGYVTWWQIHTATLQAQVQAQRSRGFAVINALRKRSNQFDNLTRQYLVTGEPRDRQHFDELPASVAMTRAAHFSDTELAALNDAQQAIKQLAQNQFRIVDAGARPRDPGKTPTTYRFLSSSTYVTQKKALVAENLTRLGNLINQRTHQQITELNVRGKRLMRSQIAFFVLLLLLSGVAFVVAERGLTRPLRDLAKRTRRIALGDYEQRVGPHNLLELKHVGETFNDMAIAIKRDIARRKHAERQALEAQADAERANRIKSDFLATMSHEIRTPLHAIIGISDLLRDTTLDNKQRDDLNIIRGSSTHLLAIINDILDFSKIEANMLELDEQEFNLRDVVEDALDLVSLKATEKNLDVMCEFEPDTPMRVTADASRIRQVLVNYLSNAVKFTEHGEVLVNVSSTSLDAEHQRFAISVRDTGIGVAPGQLDRLFKPFSQADAATTRHFGGTGLGLAICKRLAELMGGGVSVESRPGAGSTFSFTFVVDTHAARPETGWPGVDYLAGKYLLIVDSNATRRRILCNTALGWRLRVTHCDSPAAALQTVAHDGHFDLALIDDPGPDTDVSQLAGELRRRHDRRGDTRLPILLLGNVNHMGHPAVEFDQVLRKPPRQKNLFEAMMQTLAPNALFVADESALPMPALPALSILVVEDHPLNRTVVLRLLKTLGQTADAVDSGVVAVQAVERKRYDLVLMDVQMPAMDGLEATRRIRRLPLPRQPHIFAMTAGVLVRERQRCIAAGMDRHLPKPIRKQDLAQALREINEADSIVPPSQALGTSTDDAIDAHAIRQLAIDLGRGGAVDVLQAMTDAAPLACRNLDEACHAGDPDSLRRQVARMKANCLMIGCTSLADASADVEESLCGSAGTNVEETCHDIAQRYTAVARQLAPWLERL